MKSVTQTDETIGTTELVLICCGCAAALVVILLVCVVAIRKG